MERDGGGPRTQRVRTDPTRPLPTGTASRSQRFAAGSRTATRKAVAGSRAAAAASGRAVKASYRGARRLTHARGAGESGLARVLELHLFASAADALIVTALASTIFFAVPTSQARDRVATSLLITMVPFILLAPVLGPMLDRWRRGRRYALATTMVVRAFLAWVMAGAIAGTDASLSLYLAAFGFLVCQKAYIVTRAAAVPRVLPSGSNLVNANARISMAGVVALAIGGALGVGVTTWAGPQWTLRLAFLVFAAGTALALALPAKVDSSEGELDARMSSTPDAVDPRVEARFDTQELPVPGRRWSIGPRVVLGLRSNAVLRAFTGFLTLFLAFRLRTDPLPGIAQTTAVGMVIALAAVGGGIGTALGGVVRRVRAEGVTVALLAVTSAIAAWSALGYGVFSIAAVSLAAGTAQALGKLCLDSLVQEEVPEQVRTSAFARSETVLQLAWVLGGGLGLVLPLSGAWGLGIAALGTAVASGFGVAMLVRQRRARERRASVRP